jgi:hypothetical protein
MHRLISLSDIDLDRWACQDWSAVARLTSSSPQPPPHAAIHRVLPRLPLIEQDIVTLYFFHGKTEVQIARLMQLSQQAVSHRLHMAYWRLKFLLAQPTISRKRMTRDLTRLIPDPRTVKVLCEWARLSSQVMTSAQLAETPQHVGRHIAAGFAALRAQPLDCDAVFYLSYFERLAQHRNVFRELLLDVARQRSDGQTERTRPQRSVPSARGAQGQVAGAA